MCLSSILNDSEPVFDCFFIFGHKKNLPVYLLLYSSRLPTLLHCIHQITPKYYSLEPEEIANSYSTAL